MQLNEKLYKNEKMNSDITLKRTNNLEQISSTSQNKNNTDYKKISDNISDTDTFNKINATMTSNSINTQNQNNIPVHSNNFINIKNNYQSISSKKVFGPPVLTCNNISKTYNLSNSEEKVIALKNITLHEDSEFYAIREGELFMIRGPSGGGKTTFLNIIGSLDSDFEGELRIMDAVINKKCSDQFLSQMRLKKIGFVFQTFNLISTMTALENVELPMIIEGKESELNRKNRAMQLLSRVGLEDRLDHLPSELSGGEQQRVAIARALTNKPAFLLLDEPTGDLDSSSTVEVMNLLLNINNHGPDNDGKGKTTIIMVTHNPELECYADRILYVQDGVIIKQIINEEQIELTVEEYLEYINKNM